MSTTALDTRHRIDELTQAADLAEDWATFAAAVEAELRSWDAYLERLQTKVAGKTPEAREQGEAAIGEFRGRRIAVGELLARPGEARHAVTAARDDLHRRADELSANCK